MKPHPLGVKIAEATVTLAELFGHYRSPIVFFIFFSVLFAPPFLVIIDRLRFSKSDAIWACLEKVDTDLSDFDVV